MVARAAGKVPAPAQDVNSPQSVPTGLQRLSNLWTAPFPAYAPSFVRSRGFGYLLSAMFGVGFLLAVSLVLRLLLLRHRRREYSA
jgi:cobalt/nickel transport system permease protein